jgi:hypothetical protein
VVTKTDYMSETSTVKLSTNIFRPSHDERLLALLQTYHHISTYRDQDFNEKLVWCLENCQGKFRDIKTSDHRIWYFENEKDAALFALKWV